MIMVFYISSLVARYMHVMIVLFLISSQVVDDFRQSTLHKREGEHNKLLENFHAAAVVQMNTKNS